MESLEFGGKFLGTKHSRSKREGPITSSDSDVGVHALPGGYLGTPVHLI